MSSLIPYEEDRYRARYPCSLECYEYWNSPSKDITWTTYNNNVLSANIFPYFNVNIFYGYVACKLCTKLPFTEMFVLLTNCVWIFTS